MGLRRVIGRILPPTVRITAAAVRARRHSQSLNVQWGVRALSEQLYARWDGVVQAGPFTGLRLPPESVAEHLGPYLAGTYERELHATWERLAGDGVPLVVDVGCKVGYYAVGLGRLFGCPSVGWDADHWARRLTRATAARNDVPVTVKRICRRSDFASLPLGAVVVIDIDGGEDVLLASPLPAGLARAVVVVELHEAVRAGVSAAVIEAFTPTHDVEVIPALPAPTPPECLAFLPSETRALAVNELRPDQAWLVARPRRV